jgi:hypothetical protein
MAVEDRKLHSPPQHSYRNRLISFKKIQAGGIHDLGKIELVVALSPSDLF